MIDLNLLHGPAILVNVSQDPITVTRIGEILLLQQGNDVSKLEPRAPWQSFVVGSSWQYMYGLYARQESVGSGNLAKPNELLEIVSPKCDIGQVSSVAGWQDGLSLALIQQNENNGLQAAICHGSSLSGVRVVEDSSVSMLFGIEECDMVYDR